MPDEYYCAKCDIISTSSACPECGSTLDKIDAGIQDDMVTDLSDDDASGRYNPELMSDDLDLDGFDLDEKDLVEAV